MRVIFLALASVLLAGPSGAGQAGTDPPPSDAAVALAPTEHPHLPEDTSQLWLPPEEGKAVRSADLKQFAQAVKLEDESKFDRALVLLTRPGLQHGPLADYVAYYRGVAELRLDRAADAKKTFRALAAREPLGYLSVGVALREAECDEALNDPAAAVAIYGRLARTKTIHPDDVLMRLARAAKAAGDLDKAANAFARVYYEFPLSDLSSVASDELDQMPNLQPIEPGTERYRLELGRAERLFGSRKYAEAREGFERLRPVATGDDRELVELRLGECDYFLRRPRSARDTVRPFTEKASRQAEALFFYALSSRQLGDQDEYLETVRRLVDGFPTQSWAEEALNNLATRYIIDDDDEQADAAFREMYLKFPKGRYAERAAWKIGWWAYKNGHYAEAAQTFEHAAATFPHSDYRPSWLYWSGRAHEALAEQSVADERFTLVADDYLNSYYGRLAMDRLKGQALHLRSIADRPATGEAAAVPPPPPNAQVVRLLLGLELYDPAENELRYAQRVWGDSPAIQATLGWIYNRQGDLRAGINAVKHAYPQYLAAGGEELPPELLKVLFPVDYWPIIRRYASAHDLDPYLMAALIAQESTFTPDVRSAANAYGLMQLLPSTGRHYARKVGYRRFSMHLLTTAESNIRMGMAYFADLVKQFGGSHFALASYNAGESRVERWISERPGVEREEFIEDIPFPETANYVKKILGTAADYRRLYGPGGELAGSGSHAAPMHRAKPSGPVKAKVGTKKKVARTAAVKPARRRTGKQAPSKKPGKKKTKSRSRQSA
ncbi:MAG: transglycosylase SLT domain-containing protein [Betaproteobacteria bacterium]